MYQHMLNFLDPFSFHNSMSFAILPEDFGSGNLMSYTVYIYICIYIYIYRVCNIYIYTCNIYIYICVCVCVITKTMCPPGYHHSGSVATHPLGHIMYGFT